MRYIIWSPLATTAIISVGTSSVTAQEQHKAGRIMKREIIPGLELMAPAEREQYRQRIHSAQSAEEETSVRAEHNRAAGRRYSWVIP